MSDDPHIPHPLHPHRTVGGRFAPGNPGKPPGAVSRLRAQVAQVVVADFLKHHALHLQVLRNSSPQAYSAMVLALANDGDVVSAAEAPPEPLDVPALLAEGEAEMAAHLAREAEFEDDLAAASAADAEDGW